MRRTSARVGDTKSHGRPLDRFDLYELAVTSPRPLARFLKAVHGRGPRTLGEDFSGTAALSRAWAELDPDHRAVAVDQSPSIIKRVERECERRGIAFRVDCLASDVRTIRAPCDILACTNFPVCYWHTREELVSYLKHARSRLNRRGVFVADLYGGSDAFVTGSKVVKLRHAGQAITYTWEQRKADPISGRVLNALHFKVGGRLIKNAFVYDWRLWSIPELSDAMREAGFRRVEVYDELGGAIDGRGHVSVQPAVELSDPYVVYVVGRK